jgi:hypothetical protein
MCAAVIVRLILYCSILLHSSIYYNIITVLMQLLVDSFKEGHTTKPAKGSKHNNHNIRVHLGISTPNDGHIGRNM